MLCKMAAYWPHVVVPAGVGALVDVRAALVGHKALVSPGAGAGEGAVAVGAHSVGPAVGQGLGREPEGVGSL